MCVYWGGGGRRALWAWLTSRGSSRVVSLDKALCSTFSILAQVYKWVPATQLPGGGGTPYNGLYGEALPERGTFFRRQVFERVGILLDKVYERAGKSVIWVCERA